MLNSIGKTILREETSDAGTGMARTICKAKASRKSVRDAAASWEAHRSGETIGKPPERASEAVARIVSEAADASQQMVERAAEEFDQMLIWRIEASKEMIQTTLQNLDVMMRVGSVLAGGSQAILSEWADYAQSAMQRNIDGVNSLMRTHTLQDLASAQSDLLTSELQLLLNSSVRISEATTRLAKDAAQSINDRVLLQNFV